MKYAIVSASGTQYRVEENQIITVDKLNPETKKLTEVLLIVDDKEIKIGNPTVKDASVDFEIVKNYQGEKMDINKFRAKSRYRKHIGFRAQLTDLKILKINS
jgi:large subunit ribosomal protein L21